MCPKTILPLIDLVFLTLGSVLGAMTQMERVESIPVEVAKVGTGSAAVRHGKFEIIALNADGLTLNGKPAKLDELTGRLAGKEVVLRADRGLPTQRTLAVLGSLAGAGARVAVEVTQTGSTGPETKGRQ